MAEEKKITETVPGGKYIVGDNYVNAEGEILGPVKASDKAADKADDDAADKKPK